MDDYILFAVNMISPTTQIFFIDD